MNHSEIPVRNQAFDGVLLTLAAFGMEKSAEHQHLPSLCAQQSCLTGVTAYTAFYESVGVITLFTIVCSCNGIHVN